MSNLVDIKNRMKVISETRKITGAMEAISVAKMGKALQYCEQNSLYFNRLRHIMRDIILSLTDFSQQWFIKKTDRAAVFVIASDRGLAGGFNYNILDVAVRKLNELNNPMVFVVGESANEFFMSQKFDTCCDFVDMTLNSSIDNCSVIAESLLKLFYSEQIGEAYIIYTSYHKGDVGSPEVFKLLPLDKEDFIGEEVAFANNEIVYEPNISDVLKRVVSQYVAGMIYGCLLQSEASEHLSRRAAMSMSTKNADELLSQLQSEYNRVRQSNITSEITDIITTSLGVENEEE